MKVFNKVIKLNAYSYELTKNSFAKQILIFI